MINTLITSFLFAAGATSFSNAPVNDAEIIVAETQTANEYVYKLTETEPEAPVETVAREFTGRFYAYSSTPDQTNGNPFVTASGLRVEHGVVANNCLPFGTRIRMPELFGDEIFYVQDRMHSRYGCESFDVWFPDRASALQFGKRSATIQVLVD